MLGLKLNHVSKRGPRRWLINLVFSITQQSKEREHHPCAVLCAKQLMMCVSVNEQEPKWSYHRNVLEILQEHVKLSDSFLSRARKSLATLTLGSSKINQHCWRFHGSGVIAAPQIIDLISFCIGMHHEYFLRSSMCFRVPHLCSKIPKITNWTGEFATVIWRLHCFTVSFRGDVRGESGPR